MPFRFIKTAAQLSAALGRNYKRFSYIVFALPPSLKYRSFEIPKRRGGVRTIRAPNGGVLKLQRQIKPLLDQLYKPRSNVHGFVEKRSIITNARTHLNSRWILNLDLEDFFHSVHYGRIKGRLIAKPYLLTAEVAHTIANAACYAGKLPQGGALSPVLANIVSDKLDAEMDRFCRKYKCRYTRYADDISISTKAKTFPPAVASLETKEGKRYVDLAEELVAIIKANGFELNQIKTRLNGPSDRREVTGLVVANRINVPRTFVRQIRAMLNAWEKYGFASASTEHFKTWRNSKGSLPKHDAKNFEYVVRGKIEFLRSVRGENDLVYSRLAARFNRLPNRNTKNFAILPVSTIELLQENTFCMDIVTYGPNYSTNRSDLSLSQGTAFFLKDVGIVTCAHCVGDEMHLYHPATKALKHVVDCELVDEISDVAILKCFDPLLRHPRKLLSADTKIMSVADELTTAGFPEAYPDGHIRVVSTTITSTIDRSQQPHTWNGDTTLRMMVERGITSGMSGGPALNRNGEVVGVCASGPSNDHPLAPCEVVPIAKILQLRVRGVSHILPKTIVFERHEGGNIIRWMARFFARMITRKN